MNIGRLLTLLLILALPLSGTAGLLASNPACAHSEAGASASPQHGDSLSAAHAMHMADMAGDAQDAHGLPDCCAGQDASVMHLCKSGHLCHSSPGQLQAPLAIVLPQLGAEKPLWQPHALLSPLRPDPFWRPPRA